MLQQQRQEGPSKGATAGKDEVMATELLVLQLPLLGERDILQHLSVHDKSLL